jgi:hypothetical protein
MADIAGILGESQVDVVDRNSAERQSFDERLHHYTLAVEWRRRLRKDEELHLRLGNTRRAGMMRAG